jgi:hypothetical protein
MNLPTGVVNATINVAYHCDIHIAGCHHWPAKRNAL